MIQQRRLSWQLTSPWMWWLYAPQPFPVEHCWDSFLRPHGEMARSWIRFANLLPPMPGAKPYDLEERSFMVCDMLQGWNVRSRAEDEEIIRDGPWGPRRYRHWEVLSDELRGALHSADGVEL
ncbi:hypothetical protein N7455_008867 [Penicillium solitum]|uniref:uncharacterized protein n=1 Tax=Penicillium solitum TaxID=60172 RepID=UPI0032C47CC0|nr:hypothetical protein N7455_008867 [Penicillium solitum]